MARINPHTGSRFDDFLKEDGVFDQVQARALKRALAEQLEDSMRHAKLTKLQMATAIVELRLIRDRHGHEPQLHHGPSRSGPGPWRRRYHLHPHL